MDTFVLVHGSWHDGSAWAPVIQHLESKGHRAFGPTVVGHGKGVNKAVTHAQSVRSIVDFIVEKNLTDVVLLGHSYGGTVISKVVEQIPDRPYHLRRRADRRLGRGCPCGQGVQDDRVAERGGS